MAVPDFILDRFGLSPGVLTRAIDDAYVRGIDYADLYLEHTVSEGMQLDGDRVKRVAAKISRGIGIRALSEGRTGYAHSDEVTPGILARAARDVRAICTASSKSAVVSVLPAVGQSSSHELYLLDKNPLAVALDERAKLLHRINAICKNYDSRILEVSASLEMEEKEVLIVSQDGRMARDMRPLVQLRVRCIAAEGAHRETGVFAGGGRIEFGKLLEGEWYRAIACEAARSAIFLLGAIDAPAGMMTVVLGNGWPGILIHEAVGHGLEGDFNRMGQSAFSGRLGERVASELCTIVDDGTIPNRRGSLNVDDEGTPTRRTVLIERGILVGYMQDRLNAGLMNMPPTGNGRRESYAHPPMPRMTNTFLCAGEAPPEDIIRSVRYGLYAKYFGGGEVDISSGNFVFEALEAYLIEDGKITAPVRGATIIGHGPSALAKVMMVGSDLFLDSGVGICGKNDQSVPVGVGMPTTRIDDMTVGGTDSVEGN